MAVTFSKWKTPIKEQDPEVRRSNFKEVCLGYSIEEGMKEAARCLQCKTKPCVAGCPVAIDIPSFIKCIREGDMAGAAEVMNKYTNLPAVCGRVCPQETQCEELCTVGKMPGFEPVAIGKLERLVADWKYTQEKTAAEKAQTASKGKVAVVGSGPSGLTVAGDLAKKGYEVTIFEALHAAGGVLIYGIPEFRLPKSIVKMEIDAMQDLGVKIECNAVVGKNITMQEIMEEFDACYIAVGAGAPHFQGVPGTTLNGVYSASEYLTRINLMHGYEFPGYDTPTKKSKKVVVIGGGNVAMDSARSAKRLGADEVTIVYRRSLKELPARIEEYHHAVEEGIVFNWLTNPTEYVNNGEGQLCGVKCIRMELGEPDASGRRRPVPVEGSEFFIEADCAIEAIGQGSNKVLLSTFPEMKLNKWGYIEADPKTGATSVPGVYAGGDIVTGAATVILAMGAGKDAAEASDKYITEKKSKYVKNQLITKRPGPRGPGLFYACSLRLLRRGIQQKYCIAEEPANTRIPIRRNAPLAPSRGDMNPKTRGVTTHPRSIARSSEPVALGWYSMESKSPIIDRSVGNPAPIPKPKARPKITKEIQLELKDRHSRETPISPAAGAASRILGILSIVLNPAVLMITAATATEIMNHETGTPLSSASAAAQSVAPSARDMRKAVR